MKGIPVIMDVAMTLSLHTLGFPASLQIIDQIDPNLPRITLRAGSAAATAACTGCGAPSSRVHGAYWRRLGDLACFGRPTFLLVRVRRFRCAAPGCPRRTFAEPLPGVGPTRARRTVRLRGVHRTIGLALGGNPGARHAATMGVAQGPPLGPTTRISKPCRTAECTLNVAVPWPQDHCFMVTRSACPTTSAIDGGPDKMFDGRDSGQLFGI